MKKRTGDPWMPAADYGRSLPAFMANLLVRDIPRSIEFYANVLEAAVLYSDPDFAALRVAGVALMLHADHTYDGHPWYKRLTSDERRGLGAELRLLGVDPDAVEQRARGRRRDDRRASHNKRPRLARGDGRRSRRLSLGRRRSDLASASTGVRRKEPRRRGDGSRHHAGLVGVASSVRRSEVEARSPPPGRPRPHSSRTG